MHGLKAAAPKVTKPAKSSGPTTAEKHIVADAMVGACAKLAAGWNPKTHGGVSAETATQLLASWLNYAPLTTWPDALGPRSGAGGRGSKTRKSA